jgi:uncharacterized protein YjbI with pentapeptide repeats
MTKAEQLQLLKQNTDSWNEWRENNPEVKIDFSKTNFRGMDLYGADFRKVNLSQADFSNANLRHAVFDSADLTHARIVEVCLNAASFHQAKLNNVRFLKADLSGTWLEEADFKYSTLDEVNFSFAKLDGADFSDTNIGWTTFGHNDLSTVIGLETVRHLGPSIIGIETLYNSRGLIPALFLSGAGLPDDFITYAHSIVGQAIEFQSCFISYSHIDEEFTRQLYSALRDAHLRVWFAPEDIKGGQKLYEQIEHAIQLHDRLLLVLSEQSLKSEWVITEVRKARKTEVRESRRKLFPIRLVDWKTIQEWECFDADTGKDLAAEVREYFIPDFSNWKDYDAFNVAFKRLLRDLRAEESNEDSGL